MLKILESKAFKLHLLLLVLFFSCAKNEASVLPLQNKSSIASNEIKTNDEIEIYSLILVNNYRAKKSGYVVSDKTITVKDFAWNKVEFDFFKRYYKDLDKIAYDNLYSESSSHKIENTFDKKLNVSLIDVELYTKAKDRVQANHDYEQQYSSKYGIISFSNIAYNSDKTQAIVFCQVWGLLPRGGGNNCILKKQNGKWVFVATTVGYVV